MIFSFSFQSSVAPPEAGDPAPFLFGQQGQVGDLDGLALSQHHPSPDQVLQIRARFPATYVAALRPSSVAPISGVPRSTLKELEPYALSPSQAARRGEADHGRQVGSRLVCQVYPFRQFALEGHEMLARPRIRRTVPPDYGPRTRGKGTVDYGAPLAFPLPVEEGLSPDTPDRYR